MTGPEPVWSGAGLQVGVALFPDGTWLVEAPGGKLELTRGGVEELARILAEAEVSAPETRSPVASELVAEFGKPVMVPADVALTWLNITGVNPADVVAFTYVSREAAEAWAAANLAHHGHPNLGIGAYKDGTWIGVTDLRPAMIKGRHERDEPRT